MSDQEGQVPGSVSGAEATVPPAPQTSSGRSVHGGGIVLGILLIVMGLALVAGRWIPSINIATAWPLVIVVLGVAQALRGRDAYGVLDGVTTVIIGGILFMNTTGRLAWGVWISIASLWPLLLIAAGIAIVGRAVSQSWLRVVAQLVIIAGLVYGALALPSGTWRFPLYVSLPASAGAMRGFEESVPADPDVERGTASVEWGAAEIKVTDGTGIAKASGQAPASWTPKLTADIGGDTVVVRAGMTGSGTVADTGGRLDLVLGRDVVWEEIALKVGATSSDLDLEQLEVERVTVDTGASDSRITIGELADQVDVEVNAGVANVVLRVPADAEVTFDVDGPATVSVPAGYAHDRADLFDNRWSKTPSSASTRIDVQVSGGMMNVRLETY